MAPCREDGWRDRRYKLQIPSSNCSSEKHNMDKYSIFGSFAFSLYCRTKRKLIKGKEEDTWLWKSKMQSLAKSLEARNSQ